MTIQRPPMTREQLRQKYLNIAKNEGYDQAITLIHRALGTKEPTTFDGGFNLERFNDLEYLRELSRELFTLKLNEESKGYYQK